jgi:hypothetical protein
MITSHQSGRDDDGGSLTSGSALERAISKLLSLHDGDVGVLEVVACGLRALPVLRKLLFAREPSGLYQPRCHVIDAVAYLGGHDMLIEFLETPREIADPVEAAGEEAVINAAARALAHRRDERVFRLLLSLAQHRRLAGPIEVLAQMRRVEALPCIVGALGDDLARPAAADALRQYGSVAVPSLLRSICKPMAAVAGESETSRRRRRSALALVMELNASSQVTPDVRAKLVREEDAILSVMACRVSLEFGTNEERRTSAERLVYWLARTSSILRKEIEECLVVNADVARPIVEGLLSATAWREDVHSPQGEALRTVARVAARVREVLETGHDDAL